MTITSALMILASAVGSAIGVSAIAFPFIHDWREKNRPRIDCDGKTVNLGHENVMYAMSALEYEGVGLRVATSPGCITDKAAN